jgi:hypothetical protein
MDIRKDSAAYVSLSSYSLVKEPDERPANRKTVVWLPTFAGNHASHDIRRSEFGKACIERTEGKPQSRLQGGAALVWRRI